MYYFGVAFFRKERDVISRFRKFFSRKIVKKSIAPFIAILLVSVLIIVLYSNRKSITVVIDGQKNDIITFEGTVKKALEKEHITLGSKDKIDKSLDSKIHDDEVITIKRAVAVNVSVDGKEVSIKSAEEDINSMLKVEGIGLNAEDKVKPEKGTKLSKDMKVVITRVNTKTVEEVIPIDFKTVVKNDNDLPNTQKKVVQEGKKGEKKVVKSVVYENGKEVGRKLVSETVVNKPVDKVVVQGTQKVLAISRGGNDFVYSKAIKVKTTAYYAVHGVGNTYTASGRKAVRNPGGYSTVAVDPSVIPFGTRLYIDGYGLAVAADTGSAIIGNFIDVFFDTYGEACRWAVKYVNAYILR